MKKKKIIDVTYLFRMRLGKFHTNSTHLNIIAIREKKFCYLFRGALLEKKDIITVNISTLILQSNSMLILKEICQYGFIFK